MPTIPPQLTRTEWQAVSIALQDAAASGCATRRRRGWLARVYQALTGNVPRRPLADDRLEAVRGFVCATRRARKPAGDFLAALRAQGFNPAQVDALALLSL